MVQAYEFYYQLRKRRRRERDQKRFESTISAIICNAIRRELMAPGEWTAVSLSKSHLARKATRYRPSLPKPLPALLDRLTKPEMDFIELRIGQQGVTGISPARRTTFRATERLRERIEEHRLTLSDLGQQLDQETIILKGAKQKGKGADRVNYADTDALRAKRGVMLQINSHIAAAEITVDNDALWQPVDSSDRFLRRFFNNGSFEQGGRLFGGFWQAIPKAERHGAIRIGDEEIAVLDYSQMGIRLLYALEGLPAPVGDAYSPPAPHYWGSLLPVKPYWPREGMKKILNAMLCRVGALKRMPRGTRLLFAAYSHLRGIKAGDVADALADYHRPVRHRFFVGYGLQLMHVESKILIDVLQTLNSEGITALPIHDAVIVAAPDKPRAAQVMRDAFYRQTGAEIEVKEEPPEDDEKPDGNKQRNVTFASVT